jgi:CelD/BcsL family acetyltransferase involved in cellulose biosynthesis
VGHGGDVTPEYLDFIVRDGWEDAAIPAVLTLVLNDPEIVEIDLQPIATSSPHLQAIASRLKAEKGMTRHDRVSRCPIAILPRTRQEFLAGQSRNYRKKVGEYERRCERHRVNLRRATSPEEVDNDLATLRELHLERWGTATRAFRSSEYVSFHSRFARLMLAQSRLRLFTLQFDARSIAVSYCFFYEGRYYYYQAGRDTSFPAERAGLVLMHRVVQEAIDDGAGVFDFLSGQESYKYRWATREDGSDRVTHWKHKAAFMAAVGQKVLTTVASIPKRLGTWKVAHG